MLKELYLDASESRNPHWMPIPFSEDQRMRFRDWDAEDAFKVPELMERRICSVTARTASSVLGERSSGFD